MSEKIPISKEDSSEKQERKKIWTTILGLGIKDTCPLETLKVKLTEYLQLPTNLEGKGPVEKAYDTMKRVSKCRENENEEPEDNKTIVFGKFRIFLIFLREYLEYYALFSIIDLDGNLLLDLNEFKQAKEDLKKYGALFDDSDMENEFRFIDYNNNGKIEFQEFCDWACKVALDANGGYEEHEE